MVDEDQFRVRVHLADPKRLLRALRDTRTEQPERRVLGRVAVTHEDDHVFLYCDTDERAAIIRDAVAGVMDEQGIEGELTVWRWHPIEERWEDPSVPMPTTEAQRKVEHGRLIESEDEESATSPYAEFEVRVSLRSHHDARELAQRLQAEGIPCRRYWRHLLFGAADEDAAQALAQRLRKESPEGTEVHVEGVGQPIIEAMQRNYAIFGGLGV